MSDLVVSFLSGVGPAQQQQFVNDTRFIGSPVQQKPPPGSKFPGGRLGNQLWLQSMGPVDGEIIPALYRRAGGKGSIGRVCVMGFSNGCTGVSELLKYKDADKIDVVIACDGIHGGYTFDKKIPLVQYKSLLNQILDVAMAPEGKDAPWFICTHSSISVGGAYPTTTETALLLYEFARQRYEQITGVAPCEFDCAHDLMIQEMAATPLPRDGRFCQSSSQGGRCFQWSSFADGLLYDQSVNNAMFMGWGEREADLSIHTRDPDQYADHIFQGKGVLPVVIQNVVIDRWNAGCGATAGYGLGRSFVAMGGFGATQSCIKQGVIYSQKLGVKEDYFPELGSQDVVAPPATGLKPAPTKPSPHEVPSGGASTPAAPAPTDPAPAPGPGSAAEAMLPPSPLKKFGFATAAFLVSWYLIKRIA